MIGIIALLEVIIAQLMRIVGRESSPSLELIPILIMVIVRGSVDTASQHRVSLYESCAYNVLFLFGDTADLLSSPLQLNTTDYIIDGMGVYVTRNNKSYLHGQMDLSDNIAYGNGINGLVYHRTDRGFVQRNKVYDNGVVPRDLEQERSEDWHQILGKGRQSYSGIVINDAIGVRLWSNIVKARDENDFAYNMISDGSTVGSITKGGNNTLCEGKVSPRLEAYLRSDTRFCDFV